MIKNIIEDIEYKNLVSKQIAQTISFILNKDLEFSVSTNLQALSFSPELPAPLYKSLAKFPLFVLSNYTYTSIKLYDDYFTFEAGFGSEGFGSVLSVPYSSVYQLALGDAILFVNPVATVEKFNEKESEKSHNIFTKNPKNKNLLS